jgi:hypothetical protein
MTKIMYNMKHPLHVKPTWIDNFMFDEEITSFQKVTNHSRKLLLQALNTPNIQIVWLFLKLR